MWCGLLGLSDFMGIRQELGINGEHRVLGNEIDAAEFRGYMISEVKHLKELINEGKKERRYDVKVFKEFCKECQTTQNKRHIAVQNELKVLNAFKNKALGLALVVGGLGAGIFQFFLDVYFKFRGG